MLLFLDFQTAIISGLLFEMKACLEKLRVLPGSLKDIFYSTLYSFLPESPHPQHLGVGGGVQGLRNIEIMNQKAH